MILSSPVDAMSLISVNNPHKPKARIARLREEICLGCGLCANACPRKHITLKFRSRRGHNTIEFCSSGCCDGYRKGKIAESDF